VPTPTPRFLEYSFLTTWVEAATIPLATVAAALPLFRRQNLPPPWMKRSPNASPLPLIIYGASSCLGCFALKLARAANIHPLIAICGGTTAYVSKLLDPKLGDVIVDYRQGVEAMKADVVQALNGLKAYHALDAISENKSWVPITQMVDPIGGYVAVVQGRGNEYNEPEIPAGVQVGYTYAGSAHYGKFQHGMPRQPEDKESVISDIDFSYVLLRYVARLLAKGEFEGHPVEIIPGGVGAVVVGLRKLQRGEAKGVKYVYRIHETVA
jgi:NADPH2:quinone reductase